MVCRCYGGSAEVSSDGMRKHIYIYELELVPEPRLRKSGVMNRCIKRGFLELVGTPFVVLCPLPRILLHLFLFASFYSFSFYSFSSSSSVKEPAT